jgi:hypothetical protein
MSDIGSVLVHVRSHAVPQEMAGSHLAGLRSHDVLPHRPRQMIAAERFALGGQEHCEVVRLERELGPRFRDVFLGPRRRAFSNRLQWEPRQSADGDHRLAYDARS